MGRKVPTGENQSIHPVLLLSLIMACIAATIAIVSSLCGSLSRKKSPPSSAARNKTAENSDVIIPTPDDATRSTIAAVELGETADTAQQQNTELQQPLPPPPGMHHMRAASYHHWTDSTTSQGKLSSSMSMRVLGSGMTSRQSSRREDNDKKREKKLKHEDSIWKKTIILGEKCKVPDEDDTIVYDEKGNKIETYHPKTPSSLPLSRQTSFLDPNAIPR
ncbi:unnamed protein product [Ilex paraguariensis]|uniref:Uncharacterized protein n=1 Tax=Ilex paraguariensis TaxID=185542 RepID=A0ABC8S5I4_9AQUA